MKRIILFVMTNLAVVLTLGLLAQLLGVNRYLEGSGLQLSRLLGYALVIGFGGAFISLLISKPIAKWSTGAEVIETPRNAQEAFLLDTVRYLSQQAGITMPQVAVYEGEPNAFATGAFRNSALVAISTSLLDNMTQEEIAAVLGHEISHVANGDMVTLTLIQGVLNTFVVFASRVLAYAVDSALRKQDETREGPGIAYMVTSIVLELLLGIAASIVVAWFSRQREFRADAGAAQLMKNREPMIHALSRLAHFQTGHLPQNVSAMGITGGMGRLFSSHPPIEERIAALQAVKNA
jgi:heat shock protein HtpX